MAEAKTCGVHEGPVDQTTAVSVGFSIVGIIIGGNFGKLLPGFLRLTVLVIFGSSPEVFPGPLHGALRPPRS